MGAGITTVRGACRLSRMLAILGVIAFCRPAVEAESPFAARVIEYAPAPGQFVRDARFNNPAHALGAPEGMGTSEGNNVSVVTLGGFGGSITLAFDHLVADDPLNAYGMDAIVFTNAFWRSGDPQVHWAECGTIEISVDANENGEADDPWCLIPGSHIPDPGAQRAVKTWDDLLDDPTYPPASGSWIPIGRSGAWTTAAYALPIDPFGSDIVRNPSPDPDAEAIFGYAEFSPTLILGDMDADNVVDDPGISLELFYTWPDDPRAVGVSAGSGGGDAFDVAWAVDPTTGEPARLPGFHFIRITSAVDAVSAILGEKSPEIDAVADAAPDPFGDFDADGDLDLVDVAALQTCFGRLVKAAPVCAPLDRQPDGTIGADDAAAFVARLTGPGS